MTREDEREREFPLKIGANKAGIEGISPCQNITAYVLHLLELIYPKLTNRYIKAH